MQNVTRENLFGERALFNSNDLHITECVFDNGESPLKESSNIEINECLFRWKYPLWYCNNIKADRCTFFDMARAGIWYTKNIEVKNTVYQAPKGFRRCDNLTLENIAFTHAQETLWSCNDVKIKDVTVKGDYFAMNCSNMEIDNLTLDGNYSFDGVKNMTIRNSHLISKDAFWNTENVTVYDSFITGEYLGWNAKNLTLVNCVIESLQGMCYVDNLVMKDCKLFNTNLAFEYSNVNAEITGDVISVLNPKSGTIKAEHIGELIIEKDKIDPSATNIICDAIDKHSDHPVYD
ncbi:MAG: DUF3737 family protein [Lachnospiraceae bacterium]|nr:DUF3737 family protein [Lachnospiraceae bacterium]MBR6303728.1 DUF3737 family protein [Lachnospiraceae bacterium]